MKGLSRINGFFQSIKKRFFEKNAAPQRMFSKIDYYRLQNVLTRQQHPSNAVHAKHMVNLRKLLLQSQVCPCKEVPSDLVTMNSVLLLRSRKGTTFKVTLVYPRDANPKEHKCSVLSFLGMNLIGKRQSEFFLRGLEIADILYQPESEGKFYV